MHACPKQPVEQAIENHRVGDIGDVEFVETNQPVALRDAPREFIEWIGRAFQLLQLAMHLAHELVEMQTRLALHRHHREEAVHQEALAAPYTAPHVDASRQLRVHDQFLECIRAACLISDPFVVAALQTFDRRELCGIRLITPRLQFVFVVFGDVHGARA